MLDWEGSAVSAATSSPVRWHLPEPPQRQAGQRLTPVQRRCQRATTVVPTPEVAASTAPAGTALDPQLQRRIAYAASVLQNMTDHEQQQLTSAIGAAPVIAKIRRRDTPREELTALTRRVRAIARWRGSGGPAGRARGHAPGRSPDGAGRPAERRDRRGRGPTRGLGRLCAVHPYRRAIPPPRA